LTFVLLWVTICLILVVEVIGKPPNIVYVLQDDNDLILGGTTPMQKTRALLENGGLEATNFFVNTPICCPSRSTMLSGRFIHNFAATHGECKSFGSGTAGNKCCMFMHLSPEWESQTLGVWLQKAGYSTAIFGKYLNNHKDFCKASNFRIPSGWDHFEAMCQLRYFGPAFNINGRHVVYNSTEYQTSVIGNRTVKYIHNLDTSQPFFIHVDPHAPHQPSQPAPWYENEFPNQVAPRTPNWNNVGTDKHWLIASNSPMDNQTIDASDTLFRKRWRTVLSVDDMIADIVAAVDSIGELNNTYFFFSSDHGFNLGTWRLPFKKNQAYDNDLRVHFWMLGPKKWPKNSTLSVPISQVDIAPTFLELAGVPVPDIMDGKSFADLIRTPTKNVVDPSRDTILFEYMGRPNNQNIGGQAIHFDAYNNTYTGLRIINDTHNLMYVEFATQSCETDDGPNWNQLSHRELYDLTQDPWQLTNIFQDWVNHFPGVLQQLQTTLASARACVGTSCINHN